MRTKVEIVLRSLQNGGEVEIEGRTYGMSEDDDLLIRMYKNDEPVWMGFDCSVTTPQP